MEFKLIIFDFDGTLADTKKGILASANAALEHHGFPKAAEKDVYPLIGLTLEEIFSKLAKNASPAQIPEIVAHYRKIYNSTAPKNTALFPGMKETLESLKAEGKLLAIATSKRQEGVNLMLDELGIRRFFSMVVTEEQVAGKKPAPDMVQKILQETGTPAAQALVVGDTVYDVQMGKNAGAKTCAVTWGAQSKEQLALSKPDFTAHNAGQMHCLLRKR